MLKNIIALVLFLLVPLAVGFLGSFVTISNIPTWYAGLNKPFFNPPNWLFGPAWTFLYITMGIAAFLVWKSEPSSARNTALIFFGIQLLLNAIWTPIFFGAHMLLLAFFELVLLWVFILLTIVKFSTVSLPAAWLLAPYVLWVSFASVLNFSVWWLNR
ncbi:MAG: TspO/MBR family protein [Candidatus Margulisiibacteriota bacterium]